MTIHTSLYEVKDLRKSNWNYEVMKVCFTDSAGPLQEYDKGSHAFDWFNQVQLIYTNKADLCFVSLLLLAALTRQML
jgi:hypothetical protein